MFKNLIPILVMAFVALSVVSPAFCSEPGLTEHPATIYVPRPLQQAPAAQSVEPIPAFVCEEPQAQFVPSPGFMPEKPEIIDLNLDELPVGIEKADADEWSSDLWTPAEEVIEPMAAAPVESFEAPEEPPVLYSVENSYNTYNYPTEAFTFVPVPAAEGKVTFASTASVSNPWYVQTLSGVLNVVTCWRPFVYDDRADRITVQAISSEEGLIPTLINNSFDTVGNAVHGIGQIVVSPF